MFNPFFSIPKNAKQINDLIFIEINKNTYDKLLQNNTEYYWELYYVVSIPWELRGEKNKVEQINRNIVALAELNYSLPGFSYYIQVSGGFLQFYPKLGILDSGSYINGVNQGYVLDNRDGRSTGVFDSQNDIGSLRRDNSISR